MATTTHRDSNSFHSTFSPFRWKVWISAASATLLLNSILFLMLPILIHPSSPTDNGAERIDAIEVIRLRQEEPPVRKKREKPPEPPEEKPEPRKDIVATQPVKTPKLTLPFELNTRLPQVAADFQLPAADSIRFGHSIDGSVGMHELDAPLTPVSRIPPVYPLRARRNGIEGWVRVAFEVETTGHINNIRILEADPAGVFEKSVMACVKRWRFNPGTVEGIPVRAGMETTVRFELE